MSGVCWSCTQGIGDRGTVSGLQYCKVSERNPLEKPTCRTPLRNAIAGCRFHSRARLWPCPGCSLCLPARRITPGFGLIFGPRCSKLGAGAECGGGWGRSVNSHPLHQGAHCCFGIFFLTWNFHRTKGKKRLLLDLAEPLASISTAAGVSSARRGRAGRAVPGPGPPRPCAPDRARAAGADPARPRLPCFEVRGSSSLSPGLPRAERPLPDFPPPKIARRFSRGTAGRGPARNHPARVCDRAQA